MDYDGDGVMDIVSGSYDPGDIYLIRGLGKGRYEAVQSILDVDGIPLVHHPNELKKFRAVPKDQQDSDAARRLRVASFASWPTFVDWDADGDDDILIGTFDGEIYLRKNIGERRAPKWAPETIRVLVGDQPLHVNQHAAPVATDWDKDGRFDLVVGVADGAVVWFKNVGKSGRPKFKPARVLVPARAESIFLLQKIEPGKTPLPGTRAQCAVVDYDKDGRLDLLVGDYREVGEKSADAPPDKEYPSKSFVWLYRRLPKK